MEGIKVKDGLPKEDTQCLVIRHGDIHVGVAWFNEHYQVWDGADGDDYLCDLDEFEWYMPFPDAPKG